MFFPEHVTWGWNLEHLLSMDPCPDLFRLLSRSTWVPTCPLPLCTVKPGLVEKSSWELAGSLQSSRILMTHLMHCAGSTNQLASSSCARLASSAASFLKVVHTLEVVGGRLPWPQDREWEGQKAVREAMFYFPCGESKFPWEDFQCVCCFAHLPPSLGFTVADLVGEKMLASVLSLTLSLFLCAVGTTSENTERHY